MKHKLYVPLMNGAVNENTRAGYLTWLERLEVDHVFLAVDQDGLYTRGEARAHLLRTLGENLAFFRANGYSVGAWLRGYGFGAPFTPEQAEIAKHYTRLRSVTGAEWEDAICPESEPFAADYADFVRDVAATGCEMIMLDDDLCVSVRPGLGCLCDKHRQLLNEALGEELPADRLPTLLFTGGENRYRSAWLKITGDSHRKFVRRVRAAIDSIDPSIRAGMCAGFTSFDLEGATAVELTRILAGQTAPFLRFTGAPYWAAKSVDRFSGQPLNAIVEDARAQQARCQNEGIEVFCESDTYPRPRTSVSSSLMECFALPMWANGGMGELGYFFDYVSSPDYETGYCRHRLYNKQLYDFVKQHMADLPAHGVRVYNEMRKIEKAHFPDVFPGEDRVMSLFFNRGAELLSMHAIPTVYGEQSACGIAFGEEARYVKELPARLILDLPAAQLLQEQGVDCGLARATPAPAPAKELFENETVNLVHSATEGFYRLALNPGARVLSEFSLGDERFPASYRYQGEGIEFLVFGFDAQRMNHFSTALLSYERQQQLLDFIGPMPRLTRCPGLYQLCKRQGDKTALLFVNVSEDPILDATVELDDRYTAAQVCGTAATLTGDRLTLNAPVPPFGAFAVVLEK